MLGVQPYMAVVARPTPPTAAGTLTEEGDGVATPFRLHAESTSAAVAPKTLLTLRWVMTFALQAGRQVIVEGPPAGTPTAVTDTHPTAALRVIAGDVIGTTGNFTIAAQANDLYGTINWTLQVTDSAGLQDTLS